MKFYRIQNSYHSQIEASAYVALRFRYTCMGVSCWPMRGLKRNDTWLQRLLPLFALTLWSHTGQRDKVRIVGLTLFGRKVVGLLTRGDDRLKRVAAEVRHS